jgi:hypothetical protein
MMSASSTHIPKLTNLLKDIYGFTYGVLGNDQLAEKAAWDVMGLMISGEVADMDLDSDIAYKVLLKSVVPICKILNRDFGAERGVGAEKPFFCLSFEQRACLYLRYRTPLNRGEVAQILDCTDSEVVETLQLARAALMESDGSHWSLHE